MKYLQSKSVFEHYLKIYENFQSEEEVKKICKKYDIMKWTINSDGLVDVDGNVIAKYQQMPGLWNMAKDQYYNVVLGSEMALKELEEFYPNWTIEDFKEVYLAMEGELPEEEM